MSRMALLVFSGLSRRLRLRAEARAPGPETNRMARRARAYWSASHASGGSGRGPVAGAGVGVGVGDQGDHLGDQVPVRGAGHDRDDHGVARRSPRRPCPTGTRARRPGRGARCPRPRTPRPSPRRSDRGMVTSTRVSAPPSRGRSWRGSGARRPPGGRRGSAAGRCAGPRARGLLPRASRTAARAAEHSGVRSPRRWPASSRVVSRMRERSPKPRPAGSSSGSGCCARHASYAAWASSFRSSRSAPPSAASTRILVGCGLELVVVDPAGPERRSPGPTRS